MSSSPAWRERSPPLLLPLPPQGDDPVVPALGSNAACAPCCPPIIERIPLRSSEPPTTPAAAAAAVPRNEPPPPAMPAIGPPAIGPPAIGPPGWPAPMGIPAPVLGAIAGVPVRQAGDMLPRASSGRGTDGTEL